MNNFLFTDNPLLGRGFGDVPCQFGHPSSGTVVHLYDDIKHVVIHYPESNINLEERRRLGISGSRRKQNKNDEPFHTANLLTVVHHVNLS